MSFPNPVSWLADQVSNFVGGAASDAFNLLVTGLMGWVMDAVVWVVGGIFNFFLDAEDPNVQADWFVTGAGPYATTAAIGATLMVGFVFAGITQGVLSGDVAGMIRRMTLDLPVSVLGIVGLVTFTQALIRLTDELSTGVMGNFEEDIADFTAVVVSVSHVSGSSSFIVLLLGIVTILAGIVLVAELAVRAALVYIVVALAPLVFAARLWPALQGACRKLLELLVALIVSKLVIAVALAVAAAAAVGTGSGGEVTSLPEPEAMAEDPGGSVTQAVGILLAATAAFGVAAFSPLLVAKLLPMTEAAIVAQGVRSGPMRAGQQALSTAYSADMLSNGRLRQLASGRPSRGSGRGGNRPGGAAGAGKGAPVSPGRSGGGGAAGAAGGGRAAVAGPVGAAVAAAKTVKGSAKKGADTAKQTAATTADQSGARPLASGRSRSPREVENRDEPVRPHGRLAENQPAPPAPRSDLAKQRPPRRQPPGGGRRGS